MWFDTGPQKDIKIFSVEEMEIKTTGWKLKFYFSVMVGKIIVIVHGPTGKIGEM